MNGILSDFMIHIRTHYVRHGIAQSKVYLYIIHTDVEHFVHNTNNSGWSEWTEKVQVDRYELHWGEKIRFFWLLLRLSLKPETL